MRVVFIGSSRFGLRCLDLINRLPFIKIVGVITGLKTFPISYRPEGVTNVLHADVQAFCNAIDLPCVTLERSMKENALHEAVVRWNPDAFLVVGWYHMIPKSWREIAPAYGLHASLLPDYSGGAPLVWAMINGEKKTGITLFQMDDGVDSGLIVGQVEESILERDTIETLYARIENLGLELLESALLRLASKTADFRAQNESNRRIFPQRTPKDGLIDWTKDAIFIDRFIRAQTRPYPGAYTFLNGDRLIIWASSCAESVAKPPGTVAQYQGGYRVSCGVGSLLIDIVHYQGEDIKATRLIDLLGSDCLSLGD
jgi:methionyl-tRNA formyltransferase